MSRFTQPFSGVAGTAANQRAPRVLVLSASVGSGHLRAAEAIELALRQLQPNAVIRNVDVLALATAPLRYSFAQCYLHLVNHAPFVVGYLYGLMDRPRPPRYGPLYHLKVLLERLNLRPFQRLCCDEPWDLVINTFFLSTEIIAALRRLGRFNAPQVQVVTDFETHGNWVNRPCELYCTATEESALYLQCYRVPREATVVTGIPIHPVFCEPKARVDCQARHGFVGDRPILLFLSGGHGVGPLREIFQALLAVEAPLEIVAVTGRNAAGREQLRAIPAPAWHRVQVRGYTEQVDELLAAADLVVTKPGGLTTAEALARGTAMVIVNPVPGQEERNSDYLLEHGAAIRVNHIPTLPHKLTKLLREPGRLAELRANARRLGRPFAAFDIVRHSLALLPRVQPSERDPGQAARMALNHEPHDRVPRNGSRTGDLLAALRKKLV